MKFTMMQGELPQFLKISLAVCEKMGWRASVAVSAQGGQVEFLVGGPEFSARLTTIATVEERGVVTCSARELLAAVEGKSVTLALDTRKAGSLRVVCGQFASDIPGALFDRKPDHPLLAGKWEHRRVWSKADIRIWKTAMRILEEEENPVIWLGNGNYGITIDLQGESASLSYGNGPQMSQSFDARPLSALSVTDTTVLRMGDNTVVFDTTYGVFAFPWKPVDGESPRQSVRSVKGLSRGVAVDAQRFIRWLDASVKGREVTGESTVILEASKEGLFAVFQDIFHWHSQMPDVPCREEWMAKVDILLLRDIAKHIETALTFCVELGVDSAFGKTPQRLVIVAAGGSAYILLPCHALKEPRQEEEALLLEEGPP